MPIPADMKILEASAALGRTVADLLLPEKEVSGVTKGKLRDELRTLAVPIKLGGGTIDDSADTKVEAGWGFYGQKNAVMCGKGKVTPFKDEADKNVCPTDNAVNVWINDQVCWENIPADVWAMTIGDYPVVKKWLSYREHKVLGRSLKLDELSYITSVVRRLKTLLLMGDAPDANYRAAAAAKQVSVTRTK